MEDKLKIQCYMTIFVVIIIALLGFAALGQLDIGTGCGVVILGLITMFFISQIGVIWD
jgi:hypothetical protein